jgi:hypothetical protein
MFRGREAIRFFSDLPESAVVRTIRDSLAGVGRAAIGPRGEIAVHPGEWTRSALAATEISGRLRRELNEYQVTIDVTCRPTAAGWALIVLGTPLLLLGWVAALAPLSARRAVAAEVRRGLETAADAVGGAAGKKYGRKDAGP